MLVGRWLGGLVGRFCNWFSSVPRVYNYIFDHLEKHIAPHWQAVDKIPPVLQLDANYCILWDKSATQVGCAVYVSPEAFFSP